jgi:hypothetical protein
MLPAAYAHLVLNHVPLIGTLAGAILLATGLVFSSSAVGRTGFAALALSALLAIPTYLTGKAAEDAVEELPGVEEERVDHHAEIAIFGLTSSLAIGVVALGSLWIYRRRPVPRALLFIVMVLALIPFGALAWTADAGGEIRHPEIRPETAETPPGREQSS